METVVSHTDEFLNLDLKIDIQKILSMMTIEHRQVLVLRYYYDLPVKDMADHLGISEVAVRSRLHRAKSEVKDALKLLMWT